MDSSSSKKKKKVIDAKKRMQNMTKEQIKAAIEKKKECNARAMTIVERLIEPQVEEFWLVENLIHINQSHFQDAVEERAITKCCGYPLCDSLLRNVPNKQFHISTKQNKVFDITDRKNYCSNLCYKAGVFLKDQLFTSPLWLRDCEDRVSYKLYSSAPISGITGQEIDLGVTSPVKLETVDPIETKVAEAEKNKKNLENVGDCDETEEEDEFEDAKEDLDGISDKMKTATIDCVEDEFFLSRSAFDRDETAAHAPSKPLPDYDQLKRESKELELKVRSFFKGDIVKVGFSVGEGEEGKTKDYDDNPSVLPLVDRHAIKATRRRIVLDKLNRT
ncbi:hypothetical protein GE061_004989 [Apolygus lucorum]|uniref:RNA polymerase II subunit B1 CTD phosphatase RPAP2 homolog n=1 Tax=Apolygus lucorum TaxID=248454 RepID=A0A8S9WXL4_APOLU|nr:hypothetical protein GE061_004989 [Apolygus lucorum]